MDKSKVIDAMKMVIGWRSLYDLCMGRTSCQGCPANKGKICTKKDTKQVMDEASEVFKEFLEE